MTYFFLKVNIKDARGLPPALLNEVYCEYSFYGSPKPVRVDAVIPPDDESESQPRVDEVAVVFNHQKVNDTCRLFVSDFIVEPCIVSTHVIVSNSSVCCDVLNSGLK